MSVCVAGSLADSLKWGGPGGAALRNPPAAVALSRLPSRQILFLVGLLSRSLWQRSPQPPIRWVLDS